MFLLACLASTVAWLAVVKTLTTLKNKQEQERRSIEQFHRIMPELLVAVRRQERFRRGMTVVIAVAIALILYTVYADDLGHFFSLVLSGMLGALLPDVWQNLKQNSIFADRN
jgi:hypothetical protein